jgi:hypothetical protein
MIPDVGEPLWRLSENSYRRYAGRHDLPPLEAKATMARRTQARTCMRRSRFQCGRAIRFRTTPARRRERSAPASMELECRKDFKQ